MAESCPIGQWAPLKPTNKMEAISALRPVVRVQKCLCTLPSLTLLSAFGHKYCPSAPVEKRMKGHVGIV